MFSGKESYLTLYSLGLAAENLVIGSKILHIVPTEKLIFADGELKSNPVMDTVTGTDAVGASVQTKATSDNALTATWFPFHSNRATPPNIRRGERVLIFRYADLDTFLWTELGLDQHLRKLETVTYVWNGTQDEADTSLTPKNSYYVEVSTHKGTITLQTSKANGEKCAYTVQFNPKAGTATLADDLGQVVFIDSVNHVIHATNADQSQLTLNKQNITVLCKDTFALTADKNITIKTQNFALTADHVTMTVSQDITFSAQTVTGNVSQEVNIQCPLIKLGGMTISNGNVSSGSLSISGTLYVSEMATMTGINSSANVTAPNI